MKNCANDRPHWSRSILNLVVLDDTQTLCDTFNFENDFFLNKIETHCK